MAKISIVVPVYFNESNLRPLYDDLREKVLNVCDSEYEIVFVDDGSTDNSWQVMEELAIEDINIRNYRLSRNFGSHAAILCGLANSTGDCAVVKAADCQEPSELIMQMVESWREGNNVVLACRAAREDSKADGFFAGVYYWMVRKLALKEMPEAGFDTYLLDRKVIEVLDRMDEKNSALTGQILWSGFKTGRVYYVRHEREIGESRWTLGKKLRLVADTLFSFSNVPIRIIWGTGFISLAVSFIWAIVVLIQKFRGGIPVEGWTASFIFQVFSFGVIMVTLAILGGYLWRTFDAARGRPVYIIEKKPEDQDEVKEKDRR